VNGDVDRAVEHRALDLLGEQPGSADRGQRRGAVAVALGLDLDDLDDEAGMGFAKAVGDPVGLPTGQPAAPGADVVFSVPDSSNAMALGFSEASGIKLEHGLIRNHYVGRTFIHPTQSHRVAKVKIKFNPVRGIIEGKKVVVVDDSLVRGTTSRGLVQMIRAAGAREVHLRLASPPITGPCHYGIDTPTREELIASTHSLEEIRAYLGVDTLGYLSLEGMVGAAGGGPFCHACFSGDYPTAVPDAPVQIQRSSPLTASSA